MEPLFLKYISQNKELEKVGGRSAVIKNPDRELLYEKLLDIEDTILEKFGLPKLMKFREVIFNLTSEKNCNKISCQLIKMAEEHLASSPERDIDLLENAKENDLKTYEVLPEIGIDDSLYAMFYFEEYFKKDKVDSKELIHVLKSIDDSTFLKIGNLHYYIVNNQNSFEAEVIFNDLKEKQIPYLEEFKNYRPIYPY